MSERSERHARHAAIFTPFFDLRDSREWPPVVEIDEPTIGRH